MKSKKLLTGILSAALVFSSLAFTAFADDVTTENPVAKIGDTLYETLAEAMNAACNMNVETIDGIPTQTKGIVIEIISDIQNQTGISSKGGKVTTYGQHYVHNIDITIEGNNHKISTGVIGSALDSPQPPNITLQSTNGKFTVKNVIAPEDIVFNLSSPQDAVSDCQQKHEAPADSLVIENCEFYGSNVGYLGRVKTAEYNNNKFLPSETSHDSADTYPLWFKLDNATLETFTFTNNTVKSQRGVQLSRLPQNLNIKYSGNNVTVANSEKPAKSSALMIGAEQNSTYIGNVEFSNNTINAYSGLCIYAPSDNNTSFNFTAANNTLGSTKLLGFNEWSSGIDADAAQTKIDSIKNNAQATWETMTDSGLYTVDTEKFGVMRFSFKTSVTDEIKSVGIKFIKANNINASLKTDDAQLTTSGNIASFYGDLTKIKADSTDKYYAAAYIITDVEPIWSDIVECTLDTNKTFTNYGGAQ